MRFRPAICSLVLVLGVLPACDDPSGPSDRVPARTFPARTMQAVLDASLDAYDGVGVSAAVLVPGEDIWCGTSGISHDETEIAPDMLLGMASITKTYTAACVLQLVEEGALALSDSLAAWLPDHPDIEGRITVRQLLDHTSGVYDYYIHPDFFDSVLAAPARVWAPEETLDFVLAPVFAPGAGWDYSNTNYVLLGMIIEAATGMNVAEQLRSRLLAPLDLGETSMAVEEDSAGIVAHGWFDLDDDGALDDVTATVPLDAFMSLEWTAGAMFSSARDLARWTAALFGGAVLGQAMRDEMLAFRPVDEPGNMYTGYGLGVGRYVISGHECFGHGGENPIYRALAAWIPESGVSIAVMMNEVDGECLLAIVEGLVEAVQGYVGD